MALNFDLFTPNSEAFISVPKCIVAVNLVKVHLILFQDNVLTNCRMQAWTDAQTHKQDRNRMYTLHWPGRADNQIYKLHNRLRTYSSQGIRDGMISQQ